MPDELHISSLVVHCRPGQAECIAARIATLPDTEIRGGIAEGKLVVLLETANEHEIVERLNAIQLLDGVFAATLVFHHCESSHPSQPSTGGTPPWTSHAGI